MISSLPDPSAQYYMKLIHDIGKNIPPRIDYPILTSTVQVISLVGLVSGFYIKTKLEKKIQLLNNNHYQNNSYKVIRVAQHAFLNRMIARIVIKIIFRGSWLPALFCMPLYTTIWLNKPYLSCEIFNISKAAAVTFMLLVMHKDVF